MLSNKRLTLSQDLPLFAIGSTNATPNWDPMLSTSPPPSLTSNLPPFKFPDSRLTFSRGRKREGPGMRLKLPPFCQEHHIQLEFLQKKDRDSSPSFTILLRRGKGRQLQWYFLWSVILLKCLFSWAANLQERAIKLCQNNFREESCGVPSDV